MKLKNHVWRFPRRTKIADFRKNAKKWKHCVIHTSDLDKADSPLPERSTIMKIILHLPT